MQVLQKDFHRQLLLSLLPTGGAINLGLNAEEGINYDVGLKGNFLRDIYIDINAFIFSLKNTIVLRRNAAGSDFYIKRRQEPNSYGIETHINYPISISQKY
ncbi:MAG: hypothetical protein WKF59_12830 [Chitinophagaceae bacterium]